MVLLRDLAQGPWPLSEHVQQLALAQARQLQEQALDRCQSKEPQLRCFGTQEGNLVLPGFFTGLSGMALALLEDRNSRQLSLDCLSAKLFNANKHSLQDP